MVEGSSTSVDIVVAEVRSRSGVSYGWPGELEYSVDENEVAEVKWNFTNFTKTWRRLDSWGVAFFLHVNARSNSQLHGLRVSIVEFPDNASPRVASKLEALKRRLSFLSVAHDDLYFELSANGSAIPLYSREELVSRPANEIVRTKYKERGDDDKGERLEKDFQAFLFGKGFESKEGRADRLALLGEDFNMMGRFEWGVDREFPTGAFDGRVVEPSRLLPTEYIDLVSLNKFGVLSLIELKINDSDLEVISQLLDYALFFAAYKDQLLPIVRDRINVTRDINLDFINCYVANNLYHQKFDDVAAFFGTNSERVGLKLIKLTLGNPQRMGG